MNAPGTAKRMPFLPENNSAKLTLVAGVSSKTFIEGSRSPI